MQTPKAKTGSLEVPQKKSPRTPRTARQLKTLSSDSDSVSTSPLSSARIPKDRSPRVPERKSPRSPATESKRPSRVGELESKLSQLQEELNKVTEQLSSSESHKKQAQQEAEEAKKQLFDMSAKLEESQQQLLEFSASEEDRVRELQKISQDRDKAWESELEAVQKQHEMDSVALASAMNEIQRFKAQLETVSEYETNQSKLVESANGEIQHLSTQLSETVSLVEKLKSELSGCRESEAEAHEVVGKYQKQLETANEMIEKLQSDGMKAMEAYNSLSLELEQSKAHIQSLEGRVSKIQAGSGDTSGNDSDPSDEINQLKSELLSMKLEADQSKSASDAAETKYQEESVRGTLQIQISHELVEQLKIEACRKEAEMEAELIKAKTSIEELKSAINEKEAQLSHVLEKNNEIGKSIYVERESELATELKTLKADMAELKTVLLDKETELQSTVEENEALKIEIKKMDMEIDISTKEASALADKTKAIELENRVKLEDAIEEAEKNSKRAARAAEQLESAQTANAEMEAELRRLKVQSDQWRKAAEAAAAILSTGNNGKVVDRTVSLDNNYPLGSPFFEDLEDDSPKKKNGNMLKKIGVLWKKNQK